MKNRFHGAAAFALLAATATCGLTSQPATAQNTAPQKEYYLDEGEVDLFGGTYRYTSTDLVAGPAGEGGLALIRYGNVGDVSRGPAHSFDIYVRRESYREDSAGASQNSYLYHVVTGRTTETFDWNRYANPGTVLKLPDGSTLTVTNTAQPTPVRYQAADGTVINFAEMGTCPAYGIFCSVADSIVTPNGATTRLAYDLSGSTRRLRLVTNSHGFGIGFEYGHSNGLLITKACALNLALTYAAAAAPCPGDAPAATYGYATDGSQNLIAFTDATNQTTTYTHGNNQTRIRWPGSSVDDIVVTIDPTSRRVTSRSNANGETWTYAYQLNEPFESAQTTHNEWTEVTSPMGGKTLHKFNAGAPKPSEILDAIGRTTQFRYVNGKPELLGRKIEPDGNEVRYAYDGRSNATETRLVAKPGSNLGDIVSTAKFPSACDNPKTCNKPEWVTDARGNTTTYQYDPGHGGVTIETLPPVGGVQPKKTYVYEERRAALRQADGTLAAGDPVQVLVRQHECAKAEGCASAAEEVHVVYDWGSATGPLLLRGKVVDPAGLNLRTCYAYDAQGNRISETTPKGNAGRTFCP